MFGTNRARNSADNRLAFGSFSDVAESQHLSIWNQYLHRDHLEISCSILKIIYTPETNIALGNPPFEDVSPIKNGGFPLRC